MSVYAISFRIAERTIGGRTYNERRDSLIEAASAQKQGFWDATTSFILTESNLDTFTFGEALSSGLNEANDMMIVFDPSDMSMAYFGDVDEPDILGTFFNLSKKLP